jgi:hypothetical protein
LYIMVKLKETAVDTPVTTAVKSAIMTISDFAPYTH